MCSSTLKSLLKRFWTFSISTISCFKYGDQTTELCSNRSLTQNKIYSQKGMFVLREETTINNFLMYACLNTFCWTWSMSYVEIYQGNDNLSINLQLETEACHSFSSTCSNMDWWFNTCTQWCLRFADTTTLQVPSTRRATLGDCAFPVAAARAWNSLPLETRAWSSLLTFQRETKSHLFRQSDVAPSTPIVSRRLHWAVQQF